MAPQVSPLGGCRAVVKGKMWVMARDSRLVPAISLPLAGVSSRLTTSKREDGRSRYQGKNRIKIIKLDGARLQARACYFPASGRGKL